MVKTHPLHLSPNASNGYGQSSDKHFLISHKHSLEHARHLRNISAAPSASHRSSTAITSLPSGHNHNIPPERDTWHVDNANTQPIPRPTTMRPRLWNPPLQPRPTVSGPAAPRSWSTRMPQPDQQPRVPEPRNVATHPRIEALPSTSSDKGKKSGRRRRNGVDNLEYQMEVAYGSEYWYRPSSDPRWREWRIGAIALTLSSTQRNTDASTSPLLPFNPVSNAGRIPTLFETTLALLFRLYGPASTTGEGAGEESALLSILDYFPPHTRRCILRYAAVHRPFDERYLRLLYAPPPNDGEHTAGETQPDDYNKEVVISGKDVDASVLEHLRLSNSTLLEQIITPHTILLFQTPNLQKRHLTTFPKTLTTLGLVALPPPSTYKRPSHINQTTTHCLCPWCTTASDRNPVANSLGTTSSSPTLSSSKHASSTTIPSAPTTATSALSALCTLPSLLPSLMTLDVSYNPWISDEAVLANVKVPITTSSKEHGILGRWDLRLWGRLKTLGVRGCLGIAGCRQGVEENVHGLGDGFEGSRVGGASMPVLVERWERSMFAVGRSVDVVWRVDSNVY